MVKEFCSGRNSLQDERAGRPRSAVISNEVSTIRKMYGLPTISGLPLHDDKERNRPEKFMTDSPKDLSQLVAIYFVVFQSRRRFVEWAQNEIAVVPDFHKRILFSDEAHFWLNGYVNKQNCRIWSEANLQVYVETPLHPEKLTVGCALWAGGILLQKR
ncbi:hypothetical protein TNCV_3820571 [Trichonephila clavipes]|nr:hypothetical protein TNCV_3820571 [Trichonephila clavipes]